MGFKQRVDQHRDSVCTPILNSLILILCNRVRDVQRLWKAERHLISITILFVPNTTFTSGLCNRVGDALKLGQEMFRSALRWHIRYLCPEQCTEQWCTRVSKHRGWSAHLVGSEEHGSEEAAVNGGLAEHDRVLLVVARVAGNCHDGIVPSWQLPEVQMLHRACRHQWFLHTTRTTVTVSCVT